MEQGDTLTNGPHQGAWVNTPAGDDWFVHFQSRLAYGRIVHLQPLKWVNDWPVIGADKDGDGIGNPVTQSLMPKVAERSENYFVAADDDFGEPELSLQWHWNANYQRNWYSLIARSGFLRLYAQQAVASDTRNLWLQPSLLLQKLSAPEFIAETTLEFPEEARKLDAGLLIFGEDYAWIGVHYDEQTKGLQIGFASCRNAREACKESFEADMPLKGNKLTLRATMIAGGGVVFAYKTEDGRFRSIGELFQARPGRWVGAKIGVFARSVEADSKRIDYVDVDSLTFRPGST